MIGSELPVGAILAYTDDELVEYMHKNRRPDACFDIDVKGWHAMSDNERDQLADRLRYAAQKAEETLQSRPVNAGELAARLLDFAREQEASPAPPSRESRRERSPTVDRDVDWEAKRWETTAYNFLIAEGGLPCYPISELDRVFRDPEGHRKALQPWQDDPDPAMLRRQVFQKQLNRWRDSRKWQRNNRGTDDPGCFSVYVKADKQHFVDLGTSWDRMYGWMTESQYMESLKRHWEQHHSFHVGAAALPRCGGRCLSTGNHGAVDLGSDPSNN